MLVARNEYFYIHARNTGLLEGASDENFVEKVFARYVNIARRSAFLPDHYPVGLPLKRVT
jgi:hypothetical protein